LSTKPLSFYNLFKGLITIFGGEANVIIIILWGRLNGKIIEMYTIGIDIFTDCASKYFNLALPTVKKEGIMKRVNSARKPFE